MHHRFDRNSRRLPIPRHPVFLVLGGAILAALAVLPLLTVAPNRLLSGQPLGLVDFPKVPLAWIIGAAAVLLWAAFRPDERTSRTVVYVAAQILLVDLLWGAGSAASRYFLPVRIDLGGAAWVILLTATLAAAEAIRRMPVSPLGRLLVALLAVVPSAALMISGHLAPLAIAREYTARPDAFWQAFLRHGQIVLTAFGSTLALGLPLGVWAHRSVKARRLLLTGLGVIQTIPSIALFGLLLTPLSRLAGAVPWLGRLGIHGVGLAPATIALVLYALLPMVRNTAAGLAAIPAETRDAAHGMGMTGWQILAKVEFPLALPVILAGLRVTLVQAIGLAAVASLIGAGGLGALMFQGLFAGADDLVLLGAAPIVLMALAVDVLFRLAVPVFRKSPP